MFWLSLILVSVCSIPPPSPTPPPLTKTTTHPHDTTHQDGTRAENMPRFAPIIQGAAGKSEHAANVRKTGLGSSAALVTSLVGAILQHFNIILLPDADAAPAEPTAEQRTQLRLVHNLAQVCHCCAQGKIGSGFDVAAAAFGSMQYIRFSPALLDDLKGKDADAACTSQPTDIARLVETDESAAVFDHCIDSWRLPPDLHLVVGDVRGSGSSTPSMVSAINRWRKDKPEEADVVWQRVIALNQQVASAMRDLTRLAAEHASAYRWALKELVAACGRRGDTGGKGGDCRE